MFIAGQLADNLPIYKIVKRLKNIYYGTLNIFNTLNLYQVYNLSNISQRKIMITKKKN